jgi:hypothetical protein
MLLPSGVHWYLTELQQSIPQNSVFYSLKFMKVRVMERILGELTSIMVLQDSNLSWLVGAVFYPFHCQRKG